MYFLIVGNPSPAVEQLAERRRVSRLLSEQAKTVMDFIQSPVKDISIDIGSHFKLKESLAEKFL
jgi:hypothetical protein